MKTKLVILCLCFAARVCELKKFTDIKNLSLTEWEDYKAAFNKQYQPDEDSYRYLIAKKRKAKIIEHNMKYAAQAVPFAMGFNFLTDLTTAEINKYLNGYYTPPTNSRKKAFKTHKKSGKRKSLKSKLKLLSLPETVDWRIEDKVSPVKDQLSCSSDWAFAPLGAIESRYAIKVNESAVSLSAQSIVDCLAIFNTDNFNRGTGCDSGYTEAVYDYIISLRGVNSEKDYPYTGDIAFCRCDFFAKIEPIYGYRQVRRFDEEALKFAVVHGPVVAAVDASLPSFHMYSHGVYWDFNCDSHKLNHAVLIVGYGYDKNSGKDYWLIKNSWGTDWGESGYMKLLRNGNNICGIATEAIFPYV